MNTLESPSSNGETESPSNAVLHNDISIHNYPRNTQSLQHSPPEHTKNEEILSEKDSLTPKGQRFYDFQLSNLINHIVKK